MSRSIWSLGAAAIAATGSLAPGSAQAEDGLVDQVERLDFERGELEAEGQFIGAREAGEDVLLLGATLEYAVSNTLQLGVEIQSARLAGDAFSLEEIGLQAKWIALDPSEAPLGLGVQAGLAMDPSTGAIGSETFLIAESRPGVFDLAANFVIATEPGEISDVSLAYALNGSRKLSDRAALGVEAGGALSGEGAGSHFLGPVLTLGLQEDGEAELELSLFAPLTEQAPDLQLRVELDFAF